MLKSLFARTLLTILSALLIMVAVIAVVSAFGFRRSVAEWNRSKAAELEATAREILLRHPDPAAVSVPDDVPLFVYDVDKQLVYSNRGESGQSGHRRGGSEDSAHGQLLPLSRDGTAGGPLLGYYRTGQLQFENDAATSRFFESMRLTVAAGLLLSLLIAVPLALVFSRSLSAPAVRLARGLGRISGGELAERIPEKGARELARIAAAVNRLSGQLERERTMRRQWIHDITHDLRTPIAAVQAQFEAMRDGVLEISPDRLEISLREIARIETLVTDLEELMRLESPEMALAVESIEVAPFVEELRERFAAGLQAKRIRFEARHGVAAMQADPRLLGRAVGNLFANALRHTPEGGAITLTVEAADDRESGGPAVRITVRNTGELIPEEELEKVFDRLYRGEYARSSPGSGLGLSIVKRIAELHGGSVRISNREGHGTAEVSVEVLLPEAVSGAGA